MLLIGSDPEVFPCTQGGDIYSVVGRLGGTKEAPHSIGGGRAYQEDNVLAEYNIPPVSTREEWLEEHTFMLGYLREVLGGVSIQSSHEFTREILQAGGVQAMRFGCDPDMNAYTGKTNESPSPFTTLRSAGGHVSFGYDSPSETTNRAVAKVADLFMGLPSVVMQPDCRRRALYGRAGSMRHKPWGVEYRTLSNFWLSSDALICWVFDQATAAFSAASDADCLVERAGGSDVVQDVINSNDVTKAKSICAGLGVSYVM